MYKQSTRDSYQNDKIEGFRQEIKIDGSIQCKFCNSRRLNVNIEIIFR